MISVRSFGKTPNGTETQLFILDNGKASVYITDFGAHIVAVNVPDKNGYLTDVVLGADSAEPYTREFAYYGATVGRFANRIEKGKFILNGKEYTVATNNGPNHLHGGLVGYNRRMFDSYVSGDTLVMSLLDHDMEEGFPGNLNFSVSFTLNENNELIIEYKAVSDADTVVNFTNHAFFNLNGAMSEKPIYNHTLQISADAYCHGDKDCLADGIIIPVRGTDMDFRTPVFLSERLNSDFEEISAIGGIDHNFVLSMEKTDVRQVAELYCPDTGICLSCETDQPGIQIYTSNRSDYKIGKCGAKYGKHSAICLETQNFPNATSFNYFPSPVLKAGEEFYSKTVYRFSVK